MNHSLTGQFLSGHVAVKHVEGITFNLFYYYVSAQELPSHTFAIAMSLYQIVNHSLFVKFIFYCENATYTVENFTLSLIRLSLSGLRTVGEPCPSDSPCCDSAHHPS